MTMETPSGAIPVALINNSVTPYRLHLHTRLAREMPDLQFWSLFTHDRSNSPWQFNAPPEIRPVFFGPGEQSLARNSFRLQRREWRKAGAILRWIDGHGIRGVILGGYNDIGRLRILCWCRRRKVPCFVFGDSNVHCDSTSGWKGWLKALLLPPLLRLAAGILYCGKLGEQYFRLYGVPTERLFRFPYEPDYTRIQNVRSEAIDAARRAYTLRAERRYLIYSGRLIAIKRVDLLLQAFLRIAPLRPDWDLIIAGAGDQLEPLHAMLPAQFAGRVIWTGFINEPDTLAALYSLAHALVLPSDYEPWGVVVTEAAVRMPVIASAVVGAAADVIADGVNGRIFRAGDVDALQECLLDVTDPSTLSAMTAAAPAQFATWHSMSDPVRGLRAALDSVDLSRPA